VAILRDTYSQVRETSLNKPSFVRVAIVATLLVAPVWASSCSDAAEKRAQQRTVVADSDYQKQIEIARKAALEIYDHGFLGNSGSAINNKPGRPPGMAIAVAVNGKLVWAEGLGFADLEQCVPAGPSTKFRIGSISKPLTAAGAALLVDGKGLDLDAPIQRYVSSFPHKGAAISTRQLLGHLGGIPRDVAAENDKANEHPYHSVTESLKWFKDEPLIAPPGTKFFYSTYGYVLASAAIEGASGQDFLSFMHDHVFQPLGMTSTVADENDKVISNRARWYLQASDGSYRNGPYLDLSYKWAGGGFLSTVEDLARFGSALLQPGFLKKETLETVFTSQQTKSGVKTNYGLGWEIHDAGDQAPERRYEHTGGVTGSGGILVIYPDQKVVIAWLMNSNDFRDWRVRTVAAPFFP
jgi:CubicO group peptidase (beta-lactamase class C family)